MNPATRGEDLDPGHDGGCCPGSGGAHQPFRGAAPGLKTVKLAFRVETAKSVDLSGWRE